MAYLAAANEDVRFTELRDENAALRASMDQMTAEMEKTHRLMRSLLGGMNPAEGDISQ
jgi:hypothetical protein